MNQPMTAQDLTEQILLARTQALAAVDDARDASAMWVGKKRDYEIAHAKAFIAAKDAKGVSDSLAKAKADIETVDLREALDHATEDKRISRLTADTWKSCLEALTGVSYSLNRELKLLEMGAGQ